MRPQVAQLWVKLFPDCVLVRRLAFALQRALIRKSELHRGRLSFKRGDEPAQCVKHCQLPVALPAELARSPGPTGRINRDRLGTSRVADVLEHVWRDTSSASFGFHTSSHTRYTVAAPGRPAINGCIHAGRSCQSSTASSVMGTTDVLVPNSAMTACSSWSREVTQ
jgi:hypothetical protein